MTPTLRAIVVGAVLLASARLVGAQDASIDRVLPTSQFRSMVFNGIYGEERTLVTRDGDRISYVREWGLVRPPGMGFSEATLVEVDRPFVVRRVRTARTVGQQTTLRDLQFSNGHVEGKILTWSGKDTITMIVDREMPAGMIDGSVYFPFLLSRYWTVGEQASIKLFDARTGEISEQTITAVARERRTIAGKELDAIRLFAITAGVSVTHWISAEVPHRLLADSSASTKSELLKVRW